MADISKLLGSGVGGPEAQIKENPIFGELSASLKNISEGITKLNENISSLVSIEAKEGKESRAETVERFKQQFETEQQASGGGDDTVLLNDIKENIQRNFLKEFKVLEMIERNTQGGLGVAGFVPGLPSGGGSKGITNKGKAGAVTGPQKKPGLLSRVGSGVKSVGKAAARFAGPLALGGLAAFSGYQGSQRAGEFFGKEQGDATLGEKTAAGIGQVASDLTFGMVDPKEFALKTKEFMDATNKFFMEDIPNFFTETLPAFFTEKFEQLKETFPETFKVITEDIPKIFTETIPQKLGEAKDIIVEKVTAVKEAIVGVFVSIGTAIKEGFQKMADFIFGIVDKIKNFGSSTVDKAKELGQGVLDFFKGPKERTTQYAAGGAIRGGDERGRDLSVGEAAVQFRNRGQRQMQLAAEQNFAVEQGLVGGRKAFITERKAQLNQMSASTLQDAALQLEQAGDQRQIIAGSGQGMTVNQITAGSQTTSVTAMKPSPRSHPSNNSFASLSSRDAVF